MSARTESVDLAKFIVDSLALPPFNQSLTILALHDKRPQELLQLLNDIFTVFDSKQKRDLRDEAPEATAVRMLDFLVVLNYKTSMDLSQFKDVLMSGSEEALFPLMAWLLQRQHELKKRAYVARYLRNAEVPEDFMGDDALCAQYQRYRELQTEFKDLHKAVDKQRASVVNPVELQKEIQQLETEQEQLNNKMGKLRQRIQADNNFEHVNFDELLNHTQALRREQEAESKLIQSLEEQRQAYYHAEQKRKHVSERVDELRAMRAHERPDELLRVLRAEVDRKTRTVEELLAKEIDDREQALRDLEHALSGTPISEQEVLDLEREVSHLSEEVTELTAARDKAQSAVDSQIGFYRDRLTAAEKRREKLREQLEDLEGDRSEAEADGRRLDDSMAALMVNGQKPRTDAEMKEYLKQLQEKTAIYKARKAEMQALWAETTVLMNTEQTLRNRDSNIQDFNKQLEEQHGIAGFQQTQDALEKVSAEKSDLDQGKARKLDEASAVVADINEALRVRKAELAPYIKELRAVRADYKEQEAEYLNRKKAFEAYAVGIEAEKLKLEQEFKTNQKGLAAEESSYHCMQSLRVITEARASALQDELSFLSGQGRLSDTNRTYQDLITSVITECEAEAKQLKKAQQKVKESHTGKVGQRKMFRELHRLLLAKQRNQQELLRKGAADAARLQESVNFVQIGDSETLALE